MILILILMLFWRDRQNFPFICVEVKALANNYELIKKWNFQTLPVFPEFPHQRALQQKYGFLVDNVDKQVMDYLFQAGWLTLYEKQRIEAELVESDRIRRLLDKLIVKPRAAFEVFRDALKDIGSEFVVCELDKKLAEIHEEDKGKKHELEMVW